MEYEKVIYQVEDGVARITFNRPASLNAFDDQMISETIAALKQASRNKAVRCIVLTGSGRAFSAGQDLKAFHIGEGGVSIGDHIRSRYNKLISLMVETGKPIIAAVNGVAAGAGFGIALAADFRIASDQASFLLAFTKIGLVPDSGTTWTLPGLVGYARAYQMALTGDPVSAEKALAWGMINDLVPHDQFEEIVAAWSGRIASGPTLAYGLTKRAMLKAHGMTLTESLEYEAQLQEISGRSQDFTEGVSAFLEKRDPQFTGR